MKRLLLLTLILLAACTRAARPTPAAPPAPPTPADELVRVDVPRATPAADLPVLTSLVQGINALGFDLYRAEAAAGTDNLILSPYSISIAFSMVYAGARGDTERQMAQVLHFLPQESHHPALNALQARIAALAEDHPASAAGDPFQLSVANAVWSQRGLTLQHPFLLVLAQHYGAGVRVVDFAADPEAAGRRIDDRVASQTAGRITELAPPPADLVLTRLFLANAVYFKASWTFPFDPAATRNGPFTLLDGRQVDVPLMHLTIPAQVPYLAGDGFQPAFLPYQGASVDMLVILPDPGRFAEVQARLSPGFFDLLRDGAEVHDLTLTVPRSDFETDYPLLDRLQELGFILPCGPGADFSGITTDAGLYIYRAVHRATITVDETGTEAAAATGVELIESVMEPAELVLDRPFLFAILDSDLGLVLFLGHVVEPVA
jgi:serpin B